MTWSAGAVLTAAQLNTYLPQAWTPWTPTITASSGTFTTVSASGRYIQYGKTVHWTLVIDITTAGTASGGVVFPLPVAVLGGAGHLGNGREAAVTGSAVQVYATSTTLGRVIKYDDTTIIASGRSLWLSGTYEAS